MNTEGESVKSGAGEAVTADEVKQPEAEAPAPAVAKEATQDEPKAEVQGKDFQPTAMDPAGVTSGAGEAKLSDLLQPLFERVGNLESAKLLERLDKLEATIEALQVELDKHGINLPSIT